MWSYSSQGIHRWYVNYPRYKKKIWHLDSGERRSQRKSMNTATNMDRDSTKYKFFIKRRHHGQPISGHSNVKKALQLNEKLQRYIDFKLQLIG